MEIEAVKLTTLAAGQSPATTPPAAADVEAFSQAMFGNMNTTPDEMMAAELQHKSRVVGQAIEGARPTLEIINSPAELKAAHSKMSKAILEVDLIAKVAGSVSQGINKLVSMQ